MFPILAVSCWTLLTLTPKLTLALLEAAKLLPTHTSIKHSNRQATWGRWRWWVIHWSRGHRIFKDYMWQSHTKQCYNERFSQQIVIPRWTKDREEMLQNRQRKWCLYRVIEIAFCCLLNVLSVCENSLRHIKWVLYTTGYRWRPVCAVSNTQHCHLVTLIGIKTIRCYPLELNIYILWFFV